MKEESKKSRPRGEKTICLPIVDESFYLEIVDDPVKFRAYIDEILPEYREIFPEEIEKGYSFFGSNFSKKQNLKIRLIQHFCQLSNLSATSSFRDAVYGRKNS